MELQKIIANIVYICNQWNMTYHHPVKVKHGNKFYDMKETVSYIEVGDEMCFVLETEKSDCQEWHKSSDELPPRKSEDSHQSLVVIVSDGFDFEKAYYDYFYGTWKGNNITPTYWMRLLKPMED